MKRSILPDTLAKPILFKMFDEFDKSTKKVKDAMYGILVCEDQNKEPVILKAFSGQMNQQYYSEGFVPPLFDIESYNKIIEEFDPKLKAIVDDLDKRTKLSNKVQRLIYDLYRVPTINKEVLSYKEIFGDKLPPTGTGDCCAPKLIAHAFNNNLHPLSLCEAYYGEDINNRKHKTIYGPCYSKCSELLKHMLKLDIIYCDDEITVVNKPAGLPSIPGKKPELKDCITSRIKTLFKDSIDQNSVHRLDMDTSGLLIIARTKSAHKSLSIAFQNREVEKCYIATVRGIVKSEKGIINLPLRLDINNRPYQIVDFENGKKAITYYYRDKVYKLNGELTTKVRLIPITGRSHQLRVHCLKELYPIVGDRLYGERKNYENRMLLQAIAIKFKHPSKDFLLNLELQPDF